MVARQEGIVPEIVEEILTADVIVILIQNRKMGEQESVLKCAGFCFFEAKTNKIKNITINIKNVLTNVPSESKISIVKEK